MYCIFIQTHTHAHTSYHTVANTHTDTLTQHIHTGILTHIHIYTYSHTQTHTSYHAVANTHTRTQTSHHTAANTNTHTRTKQCQRKSIIRNVFPNVRQRQCLLLLIVEMSPWITVQVFSRLLFSNFLLLLSRVITDVAHLFYINVWKLMRLNITKW
jgi:hypothetical protein